MLRRTEAIKNFLIKNTHQDLAALYDAGLEVQVNVAQDGFQRVEVGDRKFAFTDGLTTWNSFRLPAKAMSDPVDNDGFVKFDFDAHVEGIGCTGWDWKKKVSRWVTFDFDAMLGHSDAHTKKLSEHEMMEVQNVLTSLPYVTLRKSTSGRGLHLYIFLNPIPTNNHTEHAALARSVLSYIAGTTGFNFSSKVDICGGNTWVWHRKMRGTDGLKLIKAGSVFDNVPKNWRDHLTVVSRKSNKTVPKLVGVSDNVFNELCGQRAKVKLDEEHLKLMNYLADKRLAGSWDADNHMLTSHTAYLRDAHRDLGFRGQFETMSTGKDYGNDINCFSGETEVITKEGVFTLAELEGTEPELLVWDGSGNWIWKKAPVRCFGIQKTRAVYIPGSDPIWATDNHEWLRYTNGKISPSRIKTTQINPRSYLVLAQRILPKIDEEGVAHGVVYGDGNLYHPTKSKENLSTRVTLFGDKQDCLPILEKYGTRSYVETENYGRLPAVLNMPGWWKTLPKEVTQEYALGFILGLIVTDGCVLGSRTQINQTCSLEEAEEIRKLAIHAGLNCGSPRRVNSNGFENGLPGWALTVSNYNIPQEYYIRGSQRDRWSKTIKLSTGGRVGQIQREEKVYCATVPLHHNFVLANNVTVGNCFAFPLRNGGWAVHRFGQGTQEHKLWTKTPKGFTKCYLNRELDLADVCRLFDATELENGGYQFPTGSAGREALLRIGVEVALPDFGIARQFRIKLVQQDTKIVCMIPEAKGDPDDPEWPKEKGYHRKVVQNPRSGLPDEAAALGDYDDMLRHIISENGEDMGWVICTDDGTWRQEPVMNVRLFMQSKGISKKDIDIILGRAVNQAWVVVCKPFQPEYPGNREWNRSPAQFKIVPTLDGESLSFPTWEKVLSHCGRSLDGPILDHKWCKDNAITTGSGYLKMWLASLFKYPEQPLPYLAFYGPQDSGKSTFHEAVCQLILDGGYMDGALALQSDANFNGELQGSILCTLEEVDLRDKKIYQKVKDWVTSNQISIHAKGQTPYKAPNYTHWVQCVNDRDFIPKFPGDTRICVMYVDALPDSDKIPKRQLWQMLQKEAPDFLAALLSMEIPDSRDRLMLPVVKTVDAEAAEYSSMNPVEQFFKERVQYVDGHYVSQEDMYQAFVAWLDNPDEAMQWSKTKFLRSVPQTIQQGRLAEAKNLLKYMGNVTLKENQAPMQKLYKIGLFLKRKSDSSTASGGSSSNQESGQPKD